MKKGSRVRITITAHVTALAASILLILCMKYESKVLFYLMLFSLALALTTSGIAYFRQTQYVIRR